MLSRRSWNITLNTTTPYLALVHHYNLQSSPLGSSDTDTSTSATNGIYPESFVVSEFSTTCNSARISSVMSSLCLLNLISSGERERIYIEPSLAVTEDEEQLWFFLSLRLLQNESSMCPRIMAKDLVIPTPLLRTFPSHISLAAWGQNDRVLH